jgi:hypothetical protein
LQRHGDEQEEASQDQQAQGSGVHLSSLETQPQKTVLPLAARQGQVASGQTTHRTKGEKTTTAFGSLRVFHSSCLAK